MRYPVRHKETNMPTLLSSDYDANSKKKNNGEEQITRKGIKIKKIIDEKMKC